MPEKFDRSKQTQERHIGSCGHRPMHSTDTRHFIDGPDGDRIPLSDVREAGSMTSEEKMSPSINTPVRCCLEWKIKTSPWTLNPSNIEEKLRSMRYITLNCMAETQLRQQRIVLMGDDCFRRNCPGKCSVFLTISQSI